MGAAKKKAVEPVPDWGWHALEALKQAEGALAPLTGARVLMALEVVRAAIAKAEGR